VFFSPINCLWEVCAAFRQNQVIFGDFSQTTIPTDAIDADWLTKPRQQSAFTVLTVVSFGVLTLALNTELLRGDRAALGLASFIGVYWVARVLVDAFYFSHTDWPKGRTFIVGHVLLTSLFWVLAVIYVGLVVWNVWLKPSA
jgi:hypothetical protein